MQLPGVTDVDRAKEHHPIDRAARAEDRRAGAVADARALLRTARCRRAWKSCPGRAAQPATPGTVYYLVRKVAAVTGRDLRSARPSLDENNRPAVELHAEHRRAAASSASVTGENIGRQLAIVLDGRVQSAPTHRIGRITDRRPHHRQLHAGGSAEPVARFCARARCRRR